MTFIVRLLGLVGAALALAGCATTEGTVREAPKRQIFVVAANPLAVEAGLAVLRRGGGAVDAAVAVQAMLSLVEPQSSGMGGGAFLNHYDSETRAVSIYDGRETAPASATPDMFLDDAGKPLPFREAVVSGRATGVPGVVRMLEAAHRDEGKLAWRALFGDAERTAREGFIVTPRLARMIVSRNPQASMPDATAYFRNADGTRMVAGDRLRNPAYAAFLGRLAAQGADAFYKGGTAARIVARTHAGPLPGTMTLADLAAYRPVKREPLCRRWRAYLLCVPPPPSSGVGLLQLMLLLERTDIAARGPEDAQAWFLFAEASRIMYADRDRYVGDPAFGSVPVTGLLDGTYLNQRAALIGMRAGPPPEAGSPSGAVPVSADRTLEPAGTSHFIVGDAEGDVVSMTTTVESIFGSGRMVDGFFLNNEMTDFAFAPRDAGGRPSINAVAGGKRPRSSMTPLIVLDERGNFVGAFGSAGGNAILAFVAKAMIASFYWDLPMPDALALPNLVARGGSFGGEVGDVPPTVMQGLRDRGIDLQPGQGEDSGVHAMRWRGAVFDGAADPRREGRAIAEPAR